MVTTRLASPIAAIAAQLSYSYSNIWYFNFTIIRKQYFRMWDTLAKHGIVVMPGQKSSTKDLPYLNEITPSRIMQKMEIPGLVTGIGLIIGTIVLLVYTIH